jgi:myo-inositol-1(or 4)-monophosphatase
MDARHEDMRQLAVRLAHEAGRYAVAQLDEHLGTEAKGSGTDVVTRVDREVERRILDGISAAYPDHALLGEETGHHGSAEAPVRWLIDPLDGTNNYVMGLPLFGVCITACIGDEPVVAVVHDSVRGISTSAVRGGGAFRDGRPVRMGPSPALTHATVSWSQGYAVTHDDPFRVRVMEVLERSAKRVLRTWAPSIDWGLLAAGKTAAFVLYRNELWGLIGGALIVSEAGGVIHDAPDHECVIVSHAEIVAQLRISLAV